MSGTRSARMFFLAALALAAALPFAGHALGRHAGPHCSTDGVPLADSPVVQFVGTGPTSRRFCCVGCGQAWLRVTGEAPVRVLVTDEATGRAVDAAQAWFVRSHVEAQPATKDRVHTFARERDALSHAKAYSGVLLAGSEKPFQGTRGNMMRTNP